MNFNMNNCCPPSPCRPEPCGCKFFVDSKCVIYDGRGFRTINLPKGSRAEHIFEWIDDILYKLMNDILPFRNVGGGAEIYKERTTDGWYEFRSLKSKDEKTLVIKQEPTFISFESATPSIKRVGDTIELYLTTEKGEYKISTIDLSDYAVASQDIHVQNVEIVGNDIVFTYNKVKSPLRVDASIFLANFYGTELKLEGTVLTLVRNGQLTPLTVDLASLKGGGAGTDTYVTDLQLNSKSIVLKQNGKTDITLDLTPVLGGGGAGTDTYVTGFALDGNTLKLTQNNGQSELSVDLSKYIFTADKHLTGMEFDNNTYVLTVKRSQNLPDISVDLSAFKPTQSNLVQNDSTSKEFIKNRNLYKEVTTDYVLTKEDNNTNIFINNGTNPVTITISAGAGLTQGLEANNSYFVSFTQVGTGLVSFTGHTLIPEGRKPQIQGQGYVVGVEVTPTISHLCGDLKQA